MRKTLCIIGLERELSQILSNSFEGKVIIHDLLPKYVANHGNLYIENTTGFGYLKIDIVVFHGIFESDFDLITALTFWGGPCFPNAFGMMNCRLKLPCLARALKVSDFTASRGMVGAGSKINAENETVAKWGNWHCGDNKTKFVGKWESSNTSVLEPFFEGVAIRIIIIGSQYLQIKMDGDTWLKSIHHDKSYLEPVDNDLLSDSRKLKEHFSLQMIANDYIVSDDGSKYLLEVNHIPNVTRFDELQTIYIMEVQKWIKSLM